MSYLKGEGEDRFTRLILIVAEGCGGCAEAVEKAKGDGRIEVLDARKDKRALDIMHALGLEAVPVVVALNEKLDKICALTKDKKEKCVQYSTIIKEE